MSFENRFDNYNGMGPVYELSEEELLTIADLPNRIWMFESYPDLKSAFGPFKNLSEQDARYSDVIRAHGSRVMGVVQFIITNWEDEERVEEHLSQLGQHHVTINAKVEYVDIVSQMFLFGLEGALKSSWSTEVEEAWGELMRFITHSMKRQMQF